MDAPVQVFSCKESSFVPLVLSVRYATDSMLQKNALKSGCNRCKTGALYQSSCSLPNKNADFDRKSAFFFFARKARSIGLFCVLDDIKEPLRNDSAAVLDFILRGLKR